MNAQKRVLIVEDEQDLLEGLAHNFKFEGYEVMTAKNGAEGLKTALKQKPDVVVLDIMLPEKDGFTVLRELRQRHREIPVLVMTARNFEADVLKGFDLGADDYVTKPFGIDELLARVRATIRRANGEPEMASFDAGDFRVDLEARRVHVRGAEVRLTPKEFELFLYMAKHPSRVLTHRTLLEAVWGEASQEQPEYLRVFMGQLRKKLEPDPSNPRYLVTEPWVGYRFNPQG
jgi:two-component system KDP operon response regulator KdpE